MAIKNCYYYKDGKLHALSVDDSRLSQAATKLGFVEADILDIDPTLHGDFTDAYSVVSGVIEFDVSIGKTKRKDKLRQKRKGLFRKTDREYIKATQLGDSTAQADLTTKAQNLRDFPTSVEWDSLNTASEIADFVPAAFTAAE